VPIQKNRLFRGRGLGVGMFVVEKHIGKNRGGLSDAGETAVSQSQQCQKRRGYGQDGIGNSRTGQGHVKEDKKNTMRR